MSNETILKIDDIYDKNLNFLIGSGASYGLFPTLGLAIKDKDGNPQTIETLATLFQKNEKTDVEYTSLFMHYYKSCIEPVMKIDFETLEIGGDPNEIKVLENYQEFVKTILSILQRKKDGRRCNVFTTNYDGCFTYAADVLLQSGNIDFVINDGARGFNKRYLQAKNFNSYLCQTGIFERHQSEIPQINLIHLHGSAYWYKDGDNIFVDHLKDHNLRRCVDDAIFKGLNAFSDVLLDDTKTIADITAIKIDRDDKDKFWETYKTLPIVNPTKWKFHETVFEEHYYQMLRLLSYELERPNAIFITFGFSFADEHILRLVQRSLSNPTLQLYVCCFNREEFESMEYHFRGFDNVMLLAVDGNLDFTAFNDKVFSRKPTLVELSDEADHDD